MKCPECGFECLPGDVECLACGIDIVLAAENKEKERIRAIEANERKERYEIEMKKELGLIPEDDDKVDVSQGKTLEDVFKKKPTCPKCGAERNPEATDCIRCGIIFDKFKYGSGGVKKEVVPTPGKYNPPPSISPEPTISAPSGLPVHDNDKTDEIDLASLDLYLKENKTQDDSWQDSLTELPLEMENQADLKPIEKPMGEPLRPVNLQTSENEEGSVAVSLDKPIKTQRKADGPPRYKIRSPQKSDSTWTIYQRKIMSRVHSFSEWIVSSWTSFESKSGGRKNALRNAGIISVILVFLACSPMLYSFFKDVRKGFQERAEKERQKTVQEEYYSHRDEVTNRIKGIIEKKEFAAAEKEIATYDIPSLKNDIRPLKNYLAEIRISDEAEKIPESSYDKKYEAYTELVKLNPQNDIYLSRREEFRSKYAENEYAKAKAYYNKGKKDPALLDKSINYIKKSTELYPGSDKYQTLKYTLMKERLLFYEGNEKIAMAARDDGMGRRLFSDQRKISVWLVNKSHEIVFVNVQYFTMLGKNGVNYTYNDTGSRMSSKLEPGEQTWGELYFRTTASPAKLTFNHLVCGKISREFP